MPEKPLLPPRMMDARLDFARRYQNWTVEDWKKVMFSDESHFELRFNALQEQEVQEAKKFQQV
jgi:hypothetical protein